MIYKIGLELEGGSYATESETKRMLAPFCQGVGEDGSLMGLETDYVYEVKLLFTLSSFQDFSCKLKDYWSSSGFKQNESCGNHLHFSFRPRENGLALAWLYGEFLKEYKQVFGGLGDKYINRLNNGYCRGDFNLQVYFKQLWYNYKDGSRYFALNYNCYRPFKTVEVRVLPWASSPDELIESISKMINLVKKYTTKEAIKVARKRYEHYINEPATIIKKAGFNVSRTEEIYGNDL